MTPRQIDKFFARLAKERPDPTTELVYTNPFTLLVAVVLSAQATDAGVNKATAGLFKLADSPEKMLELGEENLCDLIKTIGLFRSKARYIIGLSHILQAQHQGQVPHDREALEALPGVGRKTANVILNTLDHAPLIAVDTHVFRVANRTGLAKGETPREVEDELMRVIPARWLVGAHHWLILHGRYTCTARAPKCMACPVHDLCNWSQKAA